MCVVYIVAQDLKMTEIKSDPSQLTQSVSLPSLITPAIVLTPEESKFMLAVRERRIKIEKGMNVNVLMEMFAQSVPEFLALRSIRNAKMIAKQAETQKLMSRFKKLF